MAESRKMYAEDKEAEVKLLERSVEELECTVNVLENKVKFVYFHITFSRSLSIFIEIVTHTFIFFRLTS